ncbi:hypothetical protein [Streptomyces sp. NBC_01304]|uniref:hypothetical protein n=1 Tax=Streptomyces sp. NBC_01304 TaxID=2903818 RepID=UPI002E163BF5|nr:hypothetical protein OG430_28150 [Streptomyces sp. NBC_01304]
MKLRHVRSIAVAAAVVVVLTGARRGGDGGGCDDDHDSSGSSSSSSGGFGVGGSSGSSGGHDDDVTSGSTSSGTSTSGNTAAPTAGAISEGKEDFWLDRCQIRRDSATQGDVKFTYRITNNNKTQSASYAGSLDFIRKWDKKVLGTTTYSVPDVGPGEVKEGVLHATVRSVDGDMETLVGKCTIPSVYKTNS